MDLIFNAESMKLDGIIQNRVKGTCTSCLKEFL